MTCKCNEPHPGVGVPYNYGQPGDEEVHPWRYPPGKKAGVGDTPASEPSTGSSTGSFLKGLAVGILAGGALSALLYVGLQDEAQRKRTVSRRQSEIARRRRAGYAY